MLKGQVISGDFVASLVLFLTVMSLFLYFSNFNQQELILKASVDYLKDKAIRIKHDLLYYTGVPSLWNPANVYAYGFADERNVLNSTKLNYLNVIGYDKVKAYYGIIQGDFFINISYLNGTSYFMFGKPPLDSNLIIKSQGLGLLRDSVVSVKVYVWR